MRSSCILICVCPYLWRAFADSLMKASLEIQLLFLWPVKPLVKSYDHCKSQACLRNLCVLCPWAHSELSLDKDQCPKGTVSRVSELPELRTDKISLGCKDIRGFVSSLACATGRDCGMDGVPGWRAWWGVPLSCPI